MIEIFRKYILKKKKKDRNGALYRHLCGAQVSQLTFNIFIKVGYYPLLALACTLYF